MKHWNSETEAREVIRDLVAEYYHDFKEPKAPFHPGDRIAYASRVYEMQALTDATLDFWLTTGRFSDRFEKEFAAWLGVKYAHLVNSGSSANLLAFMALTNGQVDCILVDDLVGESYAATIPGLKVVATPYEQEDFAFGVSKGNTALVDAINAVLDELIEDGTVTEIILKHSAN